jgi:hypothetical protein
MTTKDIPTALDRLALRALYDQAVEQINTDRDGILTTNFYAKTGDAVFQCWLSCALRCPNRHSKDAHGFCTSRSR